MEILSTFFILIFLLMYDLSNGSGSGSGEVQYYEDGSQYYKQLIDIFATKKVIPFQSETDKQEHLAICNEVYHHRKIPTNEYRKFHPRVRATSDILVVESRLKRPPMNVKYYNIPGVLCCRDETDETKSFCLIYTINKHYYTFTYSTIYLGRPDGLRLTGRYIPQP